MGRLLLLEGRAAPAEVVCEGEVLLGRAPEAEVRILDETASRRHAAVRPDGGRTVLVDLGSANGTFLNGERVERPAVLLDGDVIAIGSVRLRYVALEAGERPTVAAAPPEAREEAALDPAAADPARRAGAAEAARRLRLVCHGALAAAEAATPEEVARALLELVVEAFAPDRAVVAWAEGEGRVRAVAAHPAGASPPASRTLRRRLLEDGAAVLLRDAAEERPDAASLVRSRYRSTLAAPLVTVEGVLGFVAVEGEAEDRWDQDDLEALAAACRQAALAVGTLRALAGARARSAARTAAGAPPLLGASPALEGVRALVAKAAAAPSPVLVTGETGTGKELVARHLHAAGPRARHPFVAVNCAALVEGLVESELFGHERGAFTGAIEARAGRFEEAGEGTLFLDEVGDLPLGLQAKLLRVLSEGTWTRVGGHEPRRARCRLVAATHRDLGAMVAAGTFREDLWYRLAVVEIPLPPLRARPGDVEPLAEAALERFAGELGRPIPRLGADAREALVAYPWPGNVRELLNVIERAVVLLDGDVVTASDLPQEVRRGGPRRTPEAEPSEVLTLKEAERRAVLAALRAAGGRKGRAAEILGTSWPTLNRKIRQHGLEAEVESLRDGD